MEFIDYNVPTATKLLIEQHDRVGGRAFSSNVTMIIKQSHLDMVLR